MSEATNNSLTLDTLMIGEPISQHHGVKCCPAIRESTDERYIVKFISIPASQVQLDALLLTGAYPTPAHAMEYFRGRAEEVLREVDTLNRLHAMEGFLPFTHAEIRKNENGVGYQVCLISPYKRSLARQMQKQPLTHLGAVNLGLDLCAALAICRRAGYLYIDLKPSNVYVTPNQGYRISDLGFISLSSLKYASFPEQYRSPYTAPEITDAMSALNDRIDIYALGLLLYQVYNNSELPAEAGGVLPPPAYADYEMAEIILKACDPNPEKRWANPLQMGQAIVAYMQRNSVNDTPIVPPPVEIPEEPAEEEIEQPEAIEEADITDDPAAMLDSILNAEDAEPVAENSSEQEASAVPEEDAVTEEAPETAETETIEDTPAEEEAAVVSDTPEEEAAQEAPENPVAPLIEIPDDPEEPVIDLSFIVDLTDDETAPTEESAAEIKLDLVSDEVQDMLARADELISHELPEPAVAPEPIDVPFPAPITLSDDTEEEAANEDGEAVINADRLSDSECQETDAEDTSDVVEDTEDTVPADEDTGEENPEENDSEEEEDDYYVNHSKHQKKGNKLVRNILIISACLALVAALIIGGIYFYQHHYLQPVHSFVIDGSVDSLTVEISSPIKDELLTVVCTDTYGNTRTQEVINGRVHFINLSPDTQYHVELKIDGFHRLTGVASGNYTTATLTEILNFTAVPGPEDGSVKLSFAVNGPDTDYWTVAYSTGNAPEETKPFPGHTVTITGLTVGSEYLFRLIPADGQYLSGTWLVRYTAQNLIYAQELTITSCIDGTVVAVWSAPEGAEGQSWVVRCYNENSYDETLTTTELQAQFTGLDPSYKYYIDVTAADMPKGTTITVPENPITITEITATPTENDTLTLNWSYSGEAPEEGWTLDYTIDGSDATQVSCQENTAQIPMYPGSTYTFDVSPKNFGTSLSYNVAQVPVFSNYNVSADNMTLRMFLTPEQKKWDIDDISEDHYRTDFKIGEEASCLVKLMKNYEKSEDKIAITYVIRDGNGVPVSLNKQTKTWKKMWDNKCCALTIPEMPEVAGEYTLDIYFDGQLVTKEPLAFSLT